MKKAVIIGAGPAGIAAADRLCDLGIKVTVLEKTAVPGGLSRTVEYKGYRFDIGGHRFLTRNKIVSDWWHSILGDDFLKASRRSSIYYKNKLFNYPVSITNVLFNMGPFEVFRIFSSYLKSRFFPVRNDDSFDARIINLFGKELYRHFFEGYTEKIWGIPCRSISADWASQRIKGLSISAAIKDAIAGGRGRAVKTLTREFNYPRLGAGMMYKAGADRVARKGGHIKFNSEVIEIKHSAGRAGSLVCRDTIDDRIFEVDGTDFCSSMPITALISALKPQPEMVVLENCARLTYRSVIIVYFILDCPDVSRDMWIYVNTPELKVGRIQNFNNWSSGLIADHSKTLLGLEYFCTEGDIMWQLSDQEMSALAADELSELKIFSKNNIIDFMVLRVPDAYPVYAKGYLAALKTVKGFTAGLTNMQCMGRCGMFRYNNMDHSILTGFMAANNIGGAAEDLWSVNAENTYLG